MQWNWKIMNAIVGTYLLSLFQVNPSNLLRKNLKRKVETAIDHKISQRPKSSPYILHTKARK